MQSPSDSSATHTETILIVGDDLTIQKGLPHLFESEGYKVETCSGGQSAISTYKAIGSIAVILDLGLSVVSGKDFLREIRHEAEFLPIIVVSAISNEDLEVLMLQLGADDYVTKPFSPRELVARVKSAIRRTSYQRYRSPDQVEFGEVCVNFAKMEAYVSGKSIDLTAHELGLLNFLVQNSERVVHRHEILSQVFGYNGARDIRTIDNLILRLRRKFEKDPANPIHIMTVRGIGYRFLH